MLAAGTTMAMSGTASANEAPDVDDVRQQLQGSVDSEIIEAMQTDLGLSADEAYQRLAVDEVTAQIEDIATDRYGADFAGTWVANGDTPTVAVTDSALADDVEALGAEAVIVDRSLNSLQADMAKLDDTSDVPSDIYAWSIDVTTNTITVDAASVDAAEAFAEDAGVSTIDVNTDAQKPETMADIIGGDAYYINGSGRCSIGFPVTHSGGSGFITAGHCGSPGDSVTGSNQQALGQFEASTFPGSDYAWVSANSSWTSVPYVMGYNQADVAVSDANEAATGASVCRSGSTTGMYCGTVGAKDQTVSYPQGTVYGMTQTDVCAEPGDSGGSWISGNSAQGVTSGGSGNCTSGGVTYFFPIDEILTAYPQLTLTTV